MSSKILQYQEEVLKSFDDKFPRSLFIIDDKMDDFVKVEDDVKDFFTSALQNQLKVVEEENKEVCLCAAIITFDGSQIIRGHRHCDCFSRLYEMKLKAGEQGFLTNKGHFVTRLEGRRLQNEAKIQSISPDGYQGNTLYSEDLY